jgi:bifunctional non-homologous end joining protein LigD
LLFGAYKGKELVWIGHAGGGYKDHQMPEILARLKALEIAKSPFSNEVEYEGVVHWVQPELVANIKYATTTRSGKIRKPAIFLGFRDDKRASQVNQGTPLANKPTKKNRGSGHSNSNWSVVELQQIRNKGELHVDGCSIPVHNVDRVIWKGITKADLLSYYNSIAAFILPHVKERPLSLYLKLKGPYAPGVYIKDMEGRQPECADVFTTPRLHKKEGRRDVIDYLICNNIPTLLFMINLGCIDVNPWTSRRTTPDRPDYIVIDLDPSDDDFTKAIETARACRELFDRIKVTAFAKTSGKTGIHVFIPCSGIGFPQARIIATSICNEIHGLVPEITTTEVSIDQRGSGLYLDPNQNDFADTVASVYSVRPAHTPNVSCPLEWKEIKPGLSPDQFTMKAMLKRLNKKGDIFLPVLDEGIGLRNQRLLSKLFL